MVFFLLHPPAAGKLIGVSLLFLRVDLREVIGVLQSGPFDDTFKHGFLIRLVGNVLDDVTQKQVVGVAVFGLDPRFKNGVV